MKLYFSKGACSLVVRIIINELGLTAEFEAVDLAAKKTASGDDYFKINPKGAVPALLLDNNEVLTENAVILQYLADQNHAYQLLSKLGDFKRYRTLEWLNYITTELHKGFGPLFNPNVPQEIKDKIFVANLNNKFAYLNKKLEKQDYLLGDHFTLPDAYLFVMLVWAIIMKFDVKQWPNLSKYFNKLLKHPSIAKSIKEEDLHLREII